MNKRQTRLFAIISTAIAVVVFVGMTIDSHRQFGTLTNADKITTEVKLGQDVWHKNNCINCHTILGEGAYFAPELGNVMKRWGVQDDPEAAFETLKAWMDSQPTGVEGRRQMPQFHLTDEEVRGLSDFLLWTGRINTQNWPPNDAG